MVTPSSITPLAAVSVSAVETERIDDRVQGRRWNLFEEQKFLLAAAQKRR
jgi:hypothetical protein